MGFADELHGDVWKVKNNSTSLAWETVWTMMPFTEVETTVGGTELGWILYEMLCDPSGH